VLGLIGVAFGWRPSLLGLVIGAAVIALGTLAFATLGLLLGGTGKAEVVLALANLLWFVLLAFSGLVVYQDRVPDAVGWLVRVSPSGALTQALLQATQHTAVAAASVVVLILWAAIGGLLAVRWFKFE
ncbi:MAG: multidrug ABC transporter permease, partial [Gordonia sp. (in: high G+C Gram-positive bacteria)]|uniref:ABC transporter permease n=1 Tax=Gordonia sp. (in: high G+C Gram-positive bacteria) TaxID=84139 RepID=UPI003BB6EF14